MDEVLNDIVLIGISGAAAWFLQRGLQRSAKQPLVCAECGCEHDSAHSPSSEGACTRCGSRLLVPADSPMAAGHWQSNPGKG